MESCPLQPQSPSKHRIRHLQDETDHTVSLPRSEFLACVEIPKSVGMGLKGPSCGVADSRTEGCQEDSVNDSSGDDQLFLSPVIGARTVASRRPLSPNIRERFFSHVLSDDENAHEKKPRALTADYKASQRRASTIPKPVPPMLNMARKHVTTSSDDMRREMIERDEGLEALVKSFPTVDAFRRHHDSVSSENSSEIASSPVLGHDLFVDNTPNSARRRSKTSSFMIRERLQRSNSETRIVTKRRESELSEYMQAADTQKSLKKSYSAENLKLAAEEPQQQWSKGTQEYVKMQIRSMGIQLGSMSTPRRKSRLIDSSSINGDGLEDGMHSWMRKSLPDYCGIMGGNDLLSHDSEGFRDEIVHGSLPAIIDYTLQLAGKRLESVHSILFNTIFYYSSVYELVGILLNRYIFVAPTAGSKEARDEIRLRIIRTFQYMLENFSHLFKGEEAVLQTVCNFAQFGFSSADETIASYVIDLTKQTVINNEFTHLELSDETVLHMDGIAEAVMLLRNLSSGISDVSPFEAEIDELSAVQYLEKRWSLDKNGADEVLRRLVARGELRKSFPQGNGSDAQPVYMMNKINPPGFYPKCLCQKQHRTGPFSLLTMHVAEFARQLTIIEQEHFRAVVPYRDFVKLSSDSSNAEPVHRWILWSNRLVSFVAMSIVSQALAVKRARMICKLFALAQECLRLGNYSSLCSIVYGIDHCAVQRLKGTWKRVEPWAIKLKDELNNLCSPMKNFELLRRFISQTDPPIIPVLPLFLKDISLAELGNTTFLNQEQTCINWEKCKIISGIFDSFQRMKCAKYHFRKISLFHAWLESNPVFDQDTLYEYAESLESHSTDQQHSPLNKRARSITRKIHKGSAARVGFRSRTAEDSFFSEISKSSTSINAPRSLSSGLEKITTYKVSAVKVELLDDTHIAMPFEEDTDCIETVCSLRNKLISRNYGSSSWTSNNFFNASSEVKFVDHWLFDQKNRMLNPKDRICERAAIGSLIFKKVTEDQAKRLSEMGLQFNGKKVAVEAPAARGKTLTVHMVNGSHTILVVNPTTTCLKAVADLRSRLDRRRYSSPEAGDNPFKHSATKKFIDCWLFTENDHVLVPPARLKDLGPEQSLHFKPMQGKDVKILKNFDLMLDGQEIPIMNPEAPDRPLRVRFIDASFSSLVVREDMTCIEAVCFLRSRMNRRQYDNTKAGENPFSSSSETKFTDSWLFDANGELFLPGATIYRSSQQATLLFQPLNEEETAALMEHDMTYKDELVKVVYNRKSCRFRRRLEKRDELRASRSGSGSPRPGMMGKAEPQSLHRAVMKNDEAAVQLALDKGADINERDKLGRTPLHIAIFRQAKMSILKKLLAVRDLDPNVKDISGMCAMHYISDTERWVSNMCELLSCPRVDITAKSAKQRTVLHRWGKMTFKTIPSEMIESLLSHLKRYSSGDTLSTSGEVKLCVDVNATDSCSKSALHLCAKFDNQRLAQWLVLHGAEVNLLDSKGRSPLYTAVVHKNRQIAYHLLPYGPKVKYKYRSKKINLVKECEDPDLKQVLAKKKR